MPATSQAVNVELVESVARVSQLYGFDRVVSIVIIGSFMVLVWYVVKNSAKREDRLAGVIDKNLLQMQQLMIVHDQRSIDAIKTMQEAFTYQRQEHKDLAELLASIRRERV